MEFNLTHLVSCLAFGLFLSMATLGRYEYRVIWFLRIGSLTVLLGLGTIYLLERRESDPPAPQVREWMNLRSELRTLVHEEIQRRGLGATDMIRVTYMGSLSPEQEEHLDAALEKSANYALGELFWDEIIAENPEAAALSEQIAENEAQVADFLARQSPLRPVVNWFVLAMVASVFPALWRKARDE